MINIEQLKQEINLIKDELIRYRRHLHTNAEIGFELHSTKAFISTKLESFGYTAINCGKCGIIANLTINKAFKTILLRADMDALPIIEKTNLEFKSHNNMHACGHDLHTTFLLGAAQILMNHKQELNCNIRFMFQPAEEILEGAKDMINNGVLNNIEYAYAMHVILNDEYNTGTYIICDREKVSQSCDYIEINVEGKSTHGGYPNLGIDPILISNYFINLVTYYQIREFNDITFTFGGINGGNTFNIIPNNVILKGSIRTFNNDSRNKLKKRIEMISNSLDNLFHSKITIKYVTEVPSLINNMDLLNNVYSYLKEVDNIYKTSEMNINDNYGGSEDFAFITNKVPSLLINICAGKNIYPLHNSKVIFDEECIINGVLCFVLIGLISK